MGECRVFAVDVDSDNIEGLLSGCEESGHAQVAISYVDGRLVVMGMVSTKSECSLTMLSDQSNRFIGIGWIRNRPRFVLDSDNKAVCWVLERMGLGISTELCD